MMKQPWYYAMLGYEPLQPTSSKPRADRSAVERDRDYEPRPLTEAQQAALDRQNAIDTAICESVDSNADELDFEDIHTFVRLEPLKDPDLIIDMIRTTKPVCGLHVLSKPYNTDIETYAQQLIEFEKRCAAKINQTAIRYLCTITIMLPLDLPCEKYASYAEKFITYMPAAVQKMPWFARNFTRGKAQYIVFCFTEREYYPDGKVQHVIQKSDFYRNPVNGRRCKADTPGAVLVISKGTVLSTETAFFSLNKTQNFHLSNAEFKRMCNRIKNALRELMEDIFNCMQHFVPALYRYKGDGHFGFRGHNIREYNRMFVNLEVKLKQVADTLRTLGLYDENAFHVLLGNLHEIQKHQKGTYKPNTHSFHYIVRFVGEKQKLRDNLLLMQSKIEKVIDDYFQRAMQSPTLQFA